MVWYLGNLAGNKCTWMSCLSFSVSHLVPAMRVAVFPGWRLAVPGMGTSDSDMTHWCRRTCWQPGTILKGGRSLFCSSSMGTAVSQPMSRAAVWHSDCTELLQQKKLKGHRTRQQVLTELATQGAFPAFASAQWSQCFCRLIGFILGIICLPLLCLPQQRVPQPSHSSHLAEDSSCPASPCSLGLGHGDEGWCFPQEQSLQPGWPFITITSSAKSTQYSPFMKRINYLGVVLLGPS